MTKAAGERGCETCVHRCMEPDSDIYCAAVNKPFGLVLTQGVPDECGPERKLWEKDVRGVASGEELEPPTGVKVYVASSWRNQRQPDVVRRLRKSGHDVYDFKEPEPGVRGFNWSDIDPEWEKWTVEQYKQALEHPLALDGFSRDWVALERADVTVLVMPCGRSAHLELGCAVGTNQFTVALLEHAHEPELMYGMVDYIAGSIDELDQVLLDFVRFRKHRQKRQLRRVASFAMGR